MNRNGWSDAQLMLSMAQAAACMGNGFHKTSKALREAGFTCLGSGAYGSAWTRPDMKGYVVKLSNVDSGDSYPAYVYWAIANPMLCVPEFKHPVFSASREEFMVMLPRYAPCSEELIESTDYDNASEIIYGYPSAPQPDSPLTRAAKELRDFFDNKVGWDFHRGNLMWDSVTKVFVITDPMCSGHVDELVSKITGRTTKCLSITEQADFNFGSLPVKEWPRPEFADRVVQVELGEGLEQHAAAQKRHPLGDMVMQIPRFPSPGLHLGKIVDWKVVRDMVAQELPKDRIGLAANWVRQNGLKPEQARNIGAAAQQWTDTRLRGRNFVHFALAPQLPAFLVNAAPSDKPLNVQHIAVPVEVLRVLRDQWKVQQENNAFIDPRAQRKFINRMDRR